MKTISNMNMKSVVHVYVAYIMAWLTNLDIWKSRGLTIYGKVLIIKSLGLSNWIYSISNNNFLKDTVPMVKDKMFRFLWKNKKVKIKRTHVQRPFQGELADGWHRTYDKIAQSCMDQKTSFSLEITAIGQQYRTIFKHGGLNFLLRLLRHALSDIL